MRPTVPSAPYGKHRAPVRVAPLCSIDEPGVADVVAALGAMPELQLGVIENGICWLITELRENDRLAFGGHIRRSVDARAMERLTAWMKLPEPERRANVVALKCGLERALSLGRAPFVRAPAGGPQGGGRERA